MSEVDIVSEGLVGKEADGLGDLTVEPCVGLVGNDADSPVTTIREPSDATL